MARGKKRHKAPPAPDLSATCQVQGCTHLAIEQLDGPDGPVWLCGSCAMLARHRLKDEAAHDAILDAVAAPLERAAAFHHGKRSR